MITVKSVFEKFVKQYHVQGIYSSGNATKDDKPCIRVVGEKDALDQIPDSFEGIPVVKKVGHQPSH